jgi:hypothetical protein
LALTTDDEHLKSRFQLSTAGVLGSASGLLFAVILKHNQLRGVVGTQGIGYIEVIPIILYGVIMVVVLNAILLAAPIRTKSTEARHNLLPCADLLAGVAWIALGCNPRHLLSRLSQQVTSKSPWKMFASSSTS